MSLLQATAKYTIHLWVADRDTRLREGFNLRKYNRYLSAWAGEVLPSKVWRVVERDFVVRQVLLPVNSRTHIGAFPHPLALFTTAFLADIFYA